MPRRSPQTERLVEVVELLSVGNAGRTLVEIARHLEVDKATCIPMLAELTRVGWLVRHPRTKAYHLGPRMVAIGQAAERSFDVVDMAHPRLVALAQELGVTCFLLARGMPELVVVDMTAGTMTARRRLRQRAAYGLGLQVGDTLPFRPPLASVLAAWADEKVTEQWLAFDASNRSHLVDVLTAVRERGFAVEQYRPDPLSLGERIAGAASGLYGTRRASLMQNDKLPPLRADLLVAAVEPEASYYPISINAPVFDANGHVSHILGVTDLDEPLSGTAVVEVGLRVSAAAQQISHDIGHR